MYKYWKLKQEIERLKADNEQLVKRLHQHERYAKQWDNMMAYTGKPQEDNLNEY